MAHVVDLRTEVTHQYVFELRYESGMLYWDRAGRVARELTKEEGWELRGMDGRRCELVHRDRNLSFNFGPAKLDLSQTQNKEVSELLSPGEFGATGDACADVVLSSLDLAFFPRIGFRVMKLYPTKTKEDAEERIRRLLLSEVHDQVEGTLGRVSEWSSQVVVERPRNMLRINVTSFEQNIQLPESVIRAARTRAREHWKDQRQARLQQLKAKRIVESYPQHGILLDLDAYIEEPPVPEALSVSDFIAAAAQDFDDVKGRVLAQRG